MYEILQTSGQIKITMDILKVAQENICILKQSQEIKIAFKKSQMAFLY